MNRWRSWSLFIGLSFSAAACTKENPAYHCQNSTCIDPSFPYCDADGTIAGTPGVCIAVTCTTGEFGKCSGDSALTCNDTGTGYVETQCAHGCDEATGCKLCEANQTVCQNGVVASCDANGAQTATTNCPLGCFEDQPRCRDIDPSNHLGTYFDMNKTPPDLDLSTIDYNVLNDNSGTIRDPSGVMPDITVPNYVVTQAAPGPKLHVYVVNNLKLGNVTVIGNDGNSQAIVFLAAGDVKVSGNVVVRQEAGMYSDPTCAGKPGVSGTAQANDAVEGYGPGGGGAVGPGGNGGIVDDGSPGGARVGGAAYGVDSLEPLVGGCMGGGYYNPITGEVDTYGAGGGGAVQITSRKSITVTGTVNTDGGQGRAFGTGPRTTVTQGGGAGGSLLLEAPVVSFAATSKLSAIGGDGYGCSPAGEFCGSRGMGGTSTSAATAGGSLSFVTAAGGSAEFYAGGGGGSVGRIRINTPTSTYAADSSAVLNASITTGTIKTR